MWGLPLRDVVCKAVTAAIPSAWHRRLRPDAIEAIWKRCSNAYGSGKPPKIARYRLVWRQRQQPAEVAAMAPVAIASRLLANRGVWDVEDDGMCPVGDPDLDVQLTPKAAAEVLQFRRAFRLTWPGKNG
jgi:hypothetical protein